MDHELILITVGALLLAGLALESVGRRTRLPRVTLLVLLGIVVGPSGLGLLPDGASDWYPLLAVVSLVMVAFLLGGKLTRQVLVEDGGPILAVSGSAVIVTAVLVAAGLWLMGVHPILCLLLAGISTSTDPAATQDVVGTERAGLPFCRTLLGIVAIDDAWGLIAFSVLLAAAHAFVGQSPLSGLYIAWTEIGGALIIGVGLGLPAAYLTGRLAPGEPTRIEALGVVFLCGGMALLFHASFLLAAMVTGLVVANFARHHTRPFHEIENFEWPFMLLFFVLAGASLDVSVLPTIGMIGAGYIVLRTLGRLVGGWLGGAMSGMAPVSRRWMGAALMPQAGVAMGMALLAAESFPEHGDTILAIAIGSTVVFELVGPVLTQIAVARNSADYSAQPETAE